MHEEMALFVNGRRVAVPQGAMVSSAFLIAGDPCRISTGGEPRTAMCGMGTCFECRAVVDGMPHTRTCQLPCRPGMKVETAG
ncbi:MAG TPA: 2Fe-2S iron-sulfur cluster-binding protein [Acidobacteriaceae bacterium]|nr:2Fe-2S iron-sulfur cluster-binding protein [Acidobacteriaceae bacterium]